MRRILLVPLVMFSCLIVSHPVHAAGGTWSMTVVGDIMLDRYVWELIKKHGPQYPFANIAPQLKGADVVLGNLEGPLTSSARHAVSGGTLVFTFDRSMASVLKQSGLTTLLLANNHTLNQGQRGLAMTRATLRQAGLEHFGDPRNRTNYHLTKTLGGEKVTWLGYDALDGRLAPVILDARRAHLKGEYVIVVPHWGHEYTLNIQPRLQREAKQLIDAGADLIIGGHPHVVEPFELYKGKLIAYSLGNFVFDQYFSTHTQQGLMLKFAFNRTSVRVELVPLLSIRSQPAVATGSVKFRLLQRLADESVVPRPIRDEIRRGMISLPL